MLRVVTTACTMNQYQISTQQLMTNETNVLAQVHTTIQTCIQGETVIRNVDVMQYTDDVVVCSIHSYTLTSGDDAEMIDRSID